MPRGDGTGPRGLGAGTGGGFGPCGAGRRFGRGMGRCFGFGRMANAVVQPQTQPVELNKEEKIKILEADREDIETELKEVKKTIEELKK